MGNVYIFTVICMFVMVAVYADVYMHNPPGGNNRLNGKNRNRENNNRLFDSQNNNRGGYNVGGKGEKEGEGTLTYIGGSLINIQWTNQHECGGTNTGCDIVLQYMCSDTIRDGANDRKTPNKDDSRPSTGLHETPGYYEQCSQRKRDDNLYQADQNLKKDDARSTRQNPNGARSGLECPEERDYYPYHAPTPWKDIAILTSNDKKCADYKAQSQNVIAKGYCSGAKGLQPIREQECKASGGTWKTKSSHGIPAPDCLKAPVSRDNHLGNTEREEGIPRTLSYNWKVPDIDEEACVLRIRYNISIGDYDPFAVDKSHNENEKNSDLLSSEYKLAPEDASDRGYVLENDPTIKPFKDYGNKRNKLDFQLAFNTAQTGRVFQDRSHKFRLSKRQNIGALKTTATVHNLNVIGKRGNIVQVYPAVEYGFEPAVLKVQKNDYVLPQWTGSLNNPKNNDGEGRNGEDKSNIIAMEPTKNQPSTVQGHPANSYPLSLNKGTFLGIDKEMAVKLSFPEKNNNVVLSVPQPPAKYTSIGCYRDRSQRAIGDSRRDFVKYPEKEVIQRCANRAKKAGNKVFAVQYKVECFTAEDAHLTYMKYGESSGCRDGRGGGWRMNVYAVGEGGASTTGNNEAARPARPAGNSESASGTTGQANEPAKYQYVGCYRDKRQRAIAGQMTQYSYSEVITKCAERAKAAGNEVFGVQNKRECFTAPNAAETYMKYGRRRGCRNGRGGGWRNSVYKIVSKDAPQESNDIGLINAQVADTSDVTTLQQLADSLTKTEEKIEEIIDEIEKDVAERKRKDEASEDEKQMNDIQMKYDEEFDDMMNDTMVAGGQTTRRRRRRSVDNKTQEDEEVEDDDDDGEEVFGEREKRERGDAAKLDDAPATVSVGVVQATTCGTYNYMCTRNNNFSNRSQKGKVVVCA